MIIGPTGQLVTLNLMLDLFEFMDRYTTPNHYNCLTFLICWIGQSPKPLYLLSFLTFQCFFIIEPIGQFVILIIKLPLKHRETYAIMMVRVAFRFKKLRYSSNPNGLGDYAT
jgi:hypothetical protein